MPVAKGDPMRNGDPAQRGFTLLLVMFAVAAMGLSLAGAGQVWQTAMQREKEAELLFIGRQFQQAIASYYEAGPGGVRQFPRTLDDLVQDQRHPQPMHHLRRLYRDPMTGGQEWGLVLREGRIIGVHSLSPRAPMRTRFTGRDEVLDGRTRYDQWVFLHGEPATVRPSAAAAGGAP